MKTLGKKGIKSIGAILCIICMACALFVGTRTVYAQNTAEIVTVSSEAEKGGIAKVAFELSENPGIWGLKFKVGYDHNAMTLKSVEIGDVFAASEVMLPESLDKEKFVFYASGSDLKNNSKNGTLIVLEFQLSDTATEGDTAISLELTQAINVEGEDVNIKMTGGKVAVVNCLHSKTEWKITKKAECEKKGTKSKICTKCDKTLETKKIKATGHLHTKLKNAVAATEKKEGYTGDTYCKDCGKCIKKGKVIAKLKKEETPEKESEKESEKPVVESEKPEAESEKPVVESEQPTTETEETLTETEEPVTETEEAVTEEASETEETEKVEDVVTPDTNEPGSPSGIIIGIILVAITVVILIFMYIKFIRKGR